MDPALLAQREAFLKRAKSTPISSSTVSTASSSHTKSSKPKKKKKKSSLFPRPKPPTASGSTQFRSKNQLRWLKLIVDFMKAPMALGKHLVQADPLTMPNLYPICLQYPVLCPGIPEQWIKPDMHKYFDDDPELSFDEIIQQVQGTDLPLETKEWLRETLKTNPKIEYKVGIDKFIFQPTLKIKNRHQLAALLERNDREGLGGIKMSDVEEALANPQRAIRKLGDSVIILTRQDKEKILFHNNKELHEETDEGLKALWRTISVDGVSETDIEQYLKNAGLTSMQGVETSRKRKVVVAPSEAVLSGHFTEVIPLLPEIIATLLYQYDITISYSDQAPTTKKPRKQARNAKILNVHLDKDLLKDYSEQ